jgi:hypothetical protein
LLYYSWLMITYIYILEKVSANLHKKISTPLSCLVSLLQNVKKNLECHAQSLVTKVSKKKKNTTECSSALQSVKNQNITSMFKCITKCH